jgi:hypothetical protein
MKIITRAKTAYIILSSINSKISQLSTPQVIRERKKQMHQ